MRKETSSRKSAECDFCHKDLGCAVGSAVEKGYWRLAHGVRFCDECLLARLDDYRDRADRLLALRLRHVLGIDLEEIEATVARAQGVIVPEQLDPVRAQSRRALKLLKQGERLSAMEAGQAAWNLVLGVFNALEVQPELLRDRRRQAGTRKTRASRMPKLDAWLLAQDLSATNDQLFAALMTSDGDDDLYRDGDEVVEVNSEGREHTITREGFDKRVTQARKQKNATSN